MLDENDDYPPYYPNLGALAKYIAHEISHLLYPICISSNFAQGVDLTHSHFYGPPQYLTPMKPEDIFNDFDYSKL